ncbi:hypothetical protein [Shewanella colwelliana]|uniref:hypothetical protein n=1 Tax=Shewanella colwelliana TaxID=23 RepID=UPI0022AF022A|nr:hypothetical protein [Shewanella colwelliana]MCZ4337826.1 hypothetical protein [Shewanella colwelliana]
MKTTKSKRGAPPKPASEKKDKRLGVIQITQDQLDSYEHAAKAEGMTKSDWVRNTLDAKAKRTSKNS